MTEKEKYFKLIKNRVDGINNSYVYPLFYVPRFARLREENLYAELNRLYAAKYVEDKEVLGKYSK